MPPLALPDEHERAPEHLARSEAVRLFVERARLVTPDFALTPENAPSVAEVCRRLDGLPLAIELAAARVRLLRVEQIVARLNDRFRLLTGGSRTTLPRQQTLRAALDWSHDLLSPPEQTLLRRLSVFAGGFTLEAVEGVCTGPEVAASQALDVLAQLVDKSMVIVETDPAASVARYRLLETIREYCHEQASAAGEVAWLRSRHRAWFLALAEEAQRRGQGAEQVEWLDRLETEYDNLKAALSWRDQDSASHVFRLRLGAALWRFWEVRGLVREGRDWLEGILADTGHDAPASASTGAERRRQPGEGPGRLRAGGRASRRGAPASAGGRRHPRGRGLPEQPRRDRARPGAIRLGRGVLLGGAADLARGRRPGGARALPQQPGTHATVPGGLRAGRGPGP